MCQKNILNTQEHASWVFDNTNCCCQFDPIQDRTNLQRQRWSKVFVPSFSNCWRSWYVGYIPGRRHLPCGPCPVQAPVTMKRRTEEEQEQENIFFLLFYLPPTKSVRILIELIPSFFVSSSYSTTHHVCWLDVWWLITSCFVISASRGKQIKN